MSGFEVAGVVLGSIPIVISALEFYMRGIGTMGRWRRFALELESLVLKLGTEEAKLQNVYEKLLRDIVPDSHIEPMLMDPFGPLWKEPATVALIRRRLWRHLKLFEDNVRRMNDAMEEMKQKLNIGSDGKVRALVFDLALPDQEIDALVKVPWVEVSGMKTQFKRVMFVLQKNEYQDLLKRLREGVSSLEDLLSGNMELEPARCRGSQVTWYRLLRDLSASVYEALRSTVTCACPGFHDFGLRLISQPAIITPNDDENEVVKSQKFQLILSTTSTTLASEANLWATSKIWNLMSLSLSARGDIITGTATATAASTTVRSTGRRSVAFSLPTPEASDTSQIGGNLCEVIGLGVSPMSNLLGKGPSPIGNLCQAIRRSRKQGSGECCGQILDTLTRHPPQAYEVYPLGSPNDNGDWSPVSLGAVLSGEAGSALMYGDRLRLAWIITSSVLQLEGTPWISHLPSHDNIFVTQKGGVLHFQDVFVMKQLPESQFPACDRVIAPPIITNKAATLTALGIILIELIFGRTMNHLRSALSNGAPSVFAEHATTGLSDYEAAMRLMDQINTRVGSNYCNAVKRCMNGDHYQGGVGFGGGSRQDVLIGVLTLLEQDLNAAMGR